MKHLRSILLIVLLLLVVMPVAAQEATPDPNVPDDVIATIIAPAPNPAGDVIIIPSDELADLVNQFSGADTYERLVIGGVIIGLALILSATIFGWKLGSSIPPSVKDWVVSTAAGGAMLTQTSIDNQGLAIIAELAGRPDLAKQLREQMTPQQAADALYKVGGDSSTDPLTQQRE